jgi:hypothetical protein
LLFQLKNYGDTTNDHHIRHSKAAKPKPKKTHAKPQRFKISSAPDPADSSHPEDFNSYESQEHKLVALYALANLSIVKGQQSRLDHPIIMLDASKNALSLAQKAVKLLL